MLSPLPLTIKTFAGLETVLAGELKEMGGQNVHVGKRVVHCEGDLRLMYKINLQVRTGLRVLCPIHSFQADTEQQLYKGIQRIDWRQYMGVSQTLAVDTVAHSSFFRHAHYISLKTKDAIVDQFRARTGRRPSVNTEKPNLRVHVHIDRNTVNVALDSSGSSLHQRGYRRLQGQAPLNEVLAAGMILLSGWTGDRPFVDPMCGSGSLLLEAGLIASNRPPGQNRSFGFERWKDFEPDLWQEVKAEVEASIRPVSSLILGQDIDRNVLRKTRENLSWANLHDAIEVRSGDFLDSHAPEGAGVVIMNPPYGERMGHQEIEGFYKAIGDTLKQSYAGYDAWILSSNVPAMKRVGLRPDKKHMLYNGSLECRYYGYRMYKGSKSVEGQG